MPVPRRDFAANLRRQNQGSGNAGDAREARGEGRRPGDVEIRQLRRGGPTMSVPGEGGVADAPGAKRESGTRAARSAAHFADAMRRYGGPAVTD
jgi:hypothetical protein